MDAFFGQFHKTFDGGLHHLNLLHGVKFRNRVIETHEETVYLQILLSDQLQEEFVSNGGTASGYSLREGVNAGLPSAWD